MESIAMKTNTTRRTFLGTLGAAAAASVTGPVLASSTASTIPSGEQVPLWKIVRDDGEVTDYAVTRTAARQMVASENRSAARHTAHETTATFSGNAYRLASVDWTLYRVAVRMLADRRREGEQVTPKDSEMCWALERVGWDHARLEADVRACLADGKRWVYATRPRHVLDIPDPVETGPEQRLYPSEHFTSRTAAFEEAAAQNRKFLAESRTAPKDWAVVLEIGSELTDIATAEHAFCGDMAIARFTTYRAVRLIRPTAEEIARFARL
jgi:hypothetical protein